MKTLTNDQMVEIGGAWGIEDIHWEGLFSDACGNCYKAIKQLLSNFDGTHEHWFWAIGAIIVDFLDVWYACGGCVEKLIEGL